MALPRQVLTGPPAVVMGLGPGGLGAARSLARLGIAVYGVYAGSAAEVGRHSRVLQGRYPVRGAGSDSQLLSLLRAIRRRVSPEARMVLLPANDRYAIFVATRRRELEDDFVLRAPEAHLGTAFLDKRATVKVCREQGIRIPPSYVPNDLADVIAAAHDVRFPVIIKPALQDDEGFPGKNVVMDDATELVTFYERRPELVARSMFQELVPSGDGHIVGVNTYSNREGKVLAWVSHRRLRQWLPDRGATCYGVTESLPTLARRTVRFLDELGYVGFAGVEYAEDRSTGEYHFLELNARVVLPNQLFADAGVDLTAIGYREMCGLPNVAAPVQRDGVHWMDFHRDAPSSLLKWRAGELGIREWLQSLRHVDSHATFELRDAKPFAATLGLMASVALGRTSGRQAGSMRAFRRTRG